MTRYHAIGVTHNGINRLLHIDLEEFGVSDPSEITKEHVVLTMKKHWGWVGDINEDSVDFTLKFCRELHKTHAERR